MCIARETDESYRYLRPRVGQIELYEIDLEPRCDDGTLPPNSPLHEWYQKMLEASERSGKSIAYPYNVGALLEGARFADIVHREYQLPFCDDWVSRDMRTRAQWYRNMVDDQGSNFDAVGTFNALSMALFTRYLGMSRQQVDDLVGRVSRDVSNTNYHTYHVL